MIKRQLLVRGLLTVSIAFSAVACGERDDVETIVEHNRDNLKTNKSELSPVANEDTVSVDNFAETARERSDSLNTGNTQILLQNGTGQPNKAESEFAPESETIDPTKPDRPK